MVDEKQRPKLDDPESLESIIAAAMKASLRFQVELTPEQLVALEAREREEASEKQARRVKRALASIPPRYQWAQLDAPALRALLGPVLDRAEEIIQARWVVFYGPARQGKTSLAAACLHAYITRQMKGWQGARFVRARELATARGQSRLGTGMSDLEYDAITGSVVVLDDVGNEKNTELNATDDVISARYDDDAITWITTGLGSRQLSAKYDDGIAGRIYEKGRTLVIRVGQVAP